MPREIVTSRDVAAQAGTGGIRGQGSGSPALPIDGYFDRLLKYIPAEVVGLYLAAQGIALSANDSGAKAALWLVFVAGLVLTPAYLVKRGVRKKLQLAVATVAFAVWVFAIGGPFGTLEFYKPWIASLLLLIYTSSVALLEPEQ